MVKLFKNILWTIITFVLLFGLIVFLANLYVVKTGEKKLADINNVENAPYILVFGASVRGNTVSHALSQRLDTAYNLYKNNKSDKIIVSGDHIQNDYNEVQAMKNYLVKKGVPENKIFMDHSGIDTFVSVLRLKENYNPDSVIFVTQEEHLKRALYFAKKIDVNAVGVPCENYSDEQFMYQTKREFLARMKAFILCEILDKDIEKFNELLKLVYDEDFD